MNRTSAHRNVARRDGRLEGEPDPEPSDKELDEGERAMKDAQRDLTSLSSAPHRDPRDAEDSRS